MPKAWVEVPSAPFLLLTCERDPIILQDDQNLGAVGFWAVRRQGIDPSPPWDPRPLPGSPGPLRCYGVGPLGDLNCSWEPLGDLGAPSTLHLQSQK